ncbi:outer membrane beta-barrel protein [Mucilaginibacter sp. RS28]|uniref:Outer membrane beta-barrel protein n=1 Tax=Mucilaginibacter straminoryzae TaxID=2932774 RepID=A0A9X2B941_9SPHI|nr:outer membrane beta-barrel protein [Mucilaginibacter straminoryzae]MCJ8210091.1 outer membrane beta-barrel protein [Mucilaginibacter straminoryzae]
MEDNLDNELRDRIREVFDNYEDASADAGWELLRQRFPEEKKRRIIPLWWYGVAALFLVAIGLWFLYPQQEVQNVVQHKSKPAITPQPDSEVNLADNGKKNSASAEDSTADQEKSKITNTGKTYPSQAGSNYMDGKYATVSKSGSNVLFAEGPNKQQSSIQAYAPDEKFAGSKVDVVTEGQKIVGLAPQSTANSAGVLKTVVAAGEKSVADSGQTAFAGDNNIVKTSVAASAQPAGNTAAAMLKMIADDKAREDAARARKQTEDHPAKKKISIAVYAATYFNYAKGSSSNDVNLGGGLTSDFSITNNLKLSTGLAIAQNSLRFDNAASVPNAVNQKAAAAAVSASYAASPASFLAAPAVSPSVKNASAVLVGLDIPINFKYQFNPQKSDTYVMAGISSGTYINETYRSTLDYPNSYASFVTVGSGFNSLSTTQQESTTKQHFNTFDFARTLNLSFGVGYPLGKYNRLIVEPFLKYPLGGLGSQDIRFGAGGINLKLNFKSASK